MGYEGRETLGRTGPFFEGAMDRMVAPGRTGRHSVRIMARSPHPGMHRVRIVALDRDDEVHDAIVRAPNPGVTDGTFSLTYPEEEPGARALRAGTPYAFRLWHEASDELVGEGRFETAHEPGTEGARRCTFGILSCHNPFADDGTLQPEALRCLEIAPRVFDQVGASRLLMMGDQVYGDLPEAQSLFEPAHFRRVAPPGRSSIFDCTRREARHLYQERHRIFWKTERFRELQARWATHPILDDHEVVDNFGSLPEHAGPRWRNVRDGALDAFHDYQARRVFGERRPPSFQHGFSVGDVAVYVMDLRSQRSAQGERIELYARSQLGQLRHFLTQHRERRAIVLVLSVPILHVPDWIATVGGKITGEGSDVADRWSYDRCQLSRDALLDVLETHRRAAPHQQLVVAGGDVHVGAAMRLNWRHDSLRTHQLVSSAISNHQGALHERIAEAVPKTSSVMGRARSIYAEAELLKGADGANRNPFGGLNVGVIDFEGRGAETGVRMRLFSHDDAPVPAPVPVFDSGWL
ncbi:MAG TPA: alkaline phosphatase D family protein [Sandaracinaceae bacterium LLY-WYZ-13_1]|nr:alkaline phosphatase D family protein [Sandaracinaceae bacterium LLY-WYZ-13_1]